MMNKAEINSSNTIDFLEFLSKKLKGNKPGQTAHELMAPRLGKELFRKFKPNGDASESAVLILLTETDNNFEILFTLRAKSLVKHSGQISFPGGKIEKNENIFDAALRETFEETGIEPENIYIAGELSTLYVPPSNSLIHPVVGFIDQDNIHITINPDEVEEAFFIPLSFLLDNSNKRIEQWNFDGLTVDVPFWDIRKITPLWGATAMMLSEFLVISQSYFSEKIK